jgi:hypothetical protein
MKEGAFTKAFLEIYTTSLELALMENINPMEDVFFDLPTQRLRGPIFKRKYQAIVQQLG